MFDRMCGLYYGRQLRSCIPCTYELYCAVCVISCNVRYTDSLPCNMRFIAQSALYNVESVLAILRYTAQAAEYNVICIIQHNLLHKAQTVLQRHSLIYAAGCPKDTIFMHTAMRPLHLCDWCRQNVLSLLSLLLDQTTLASTSLLLAIHRQCCKVLAGCVSSISAFFLLSSHKTNMTYITKL